MGPILIVTTPKISAPLRSIGMEGGSPLLSSIQASGRRIRQRLAAEGNQVEVEVAHALRATQ